MSRTFTKLFSSITESTVWCEPDRTRLVWICMLAMADRMGRVWASVPGLANRARVPLQDAEAALTTFLGPDPYSRTPEHEGRRIEPIDGGWRLLNHEKYRAIRDEETTKEAKRNYINTRRAKERVENVEHVSNTVEHSRDNAEADTEADAVVSTKPKRTRTAARSFEVPEWVPAVQWGHFLEHRGAMRGVPFTLAAKQSVVAKLDDLKSRGFDPATLLSEAVEKGWRTVFEPKTQALRPSNVSDRRAATLAGLSNRGNHAASDSRTIDV